MRVGDSLKEWASVHLTRKHTSKKHLDVILERPAATELCSSY